ncbi:unnamed protein product [Cuscuta campestris]|uniref:Uncharacterized protein n=1 Tax=Cuscuta campestris TaxID=132261 RepID=A0A484MP02_9ASTE|nr:unnamed protein product [Cuscuta campestris]
MLCKNSSAIKIFISAETKCGSLPSSSRRQSRPTERLVFTKSSDAMDLDQLQSTMRTFELACTSVQVYGDPAAEAIISSLSQSIRPYRVCQFILEHSQVAMAQFQAAGALRDAAIREWVFLEDDDKRHLIRPFCETHIVIPFSI